VRGVFWYTLLFNRPQRKKSAGVRSGDVYDKFLAGFFLENVSDEVVEKIKTHILYSVTFLFLKILLFIRYSTVLKKLYLGQPKMTIHFSTYASFPFLKLSLNPNLT
jgi:hypothetical protein